MEQIPESITIKVHQSFESARPTWAALEQKGQWYPFQSYAWLETWYKTIGRANGWELCITELRSAACTMLFPLGIKTQKGMRSMEWLGYGVSDYASPLYDHFEPALMTPTLKALRTAAREASCDMLFLDRIPALSPDGSPNPFTSKDFKRLHYASYALRLDPSKPPAHTLSPKERYNLRRAEKKLAGNSSIGYIVAENPEQRETLTRHMIQQKRARFAQMRVPDNFTIPGFAEFYLQASLQPDVSVHISALMKEETPLALHWGLMQQPRFYYLMPSFLMNEEVSRYSPGNTLLMHLFDTALADGCTIFDFANGDEPYKKKWCTIQMPLMYYQTPLSAKALPTFLLFHLLETIKRSPLLKTRGQTPPLVLSTLCKGLKQKG